MKNSELAKQVQNFEDIIRKIFEECRAGGLIGPAYDYESFDFEKSYVNVIGYDYRCGGDYDSFQIPYTDLDDVSTFIIRRKAEEAEERRKAIEKEIAERKAKEIKCEEERHKLYLELKKKYDQN
jgi:hypothetical protein